jgi:hypothetical protein
MCYCGENWHTILNPSICEQDLILHLSSHFFISLEVYNFLCEVLVHFIIQDLQLLLQWQINTIFYCGKINIIQG